MSNNDESCLVRHFTSYCEISENDQALLRSLEHSPKDLHAREPLWHEYDRAQKFCTLKSGWAYCYRDLAGGNRQVLEVYMPGDIIGLRGFAFPRHKTAAIMLSKGTICPFPLKDLLVIFGASEALTILFFAMAAREQTLLVERLVNLGRRSAFEKLANFIAELYARLKATNPQLGEVMPLPVTHEVLGDALGLSAVHISRTFAELRAQGLLDYRKSRVSIPDLARLAEAGGFADGRLDKDVKEFLAETVTAEGVHGNSRTRVVERSASGRGSRGHREAARRVRVE